MYEFTQRKTRPFDVHMSFESDRSFAGAFANTLLPQSDCRGRWHVSAFMVATL